MRASLKEPLAAEKFSAVSEKQQDADPPIRFSSALLKVASRCNLDCDYCYVYKHADQSWREQPHFMSDATILRFAERLRDYVALHGLPEFSVTFHGGEPLLYGADRLVVATERIREAVPARCKIDFSLQTNATLLTNEAIDRLSDGHISVSLSLDGPRQAHDLHRLDHSGGSSYDRVMEAIERLQSRKPAIFTGVISVIDTRINPRELFAFLSQLKLSRLDLLLPDATHMRLPPGRIQDSEVYTAWLRDAFTTWFCEYPELPIRWFDAVLASRLGVPSPTDAMGLGSVSMLVIDTNGSYTDHDVFKIIGPGAINLSRTLETASFEEISRHPSILKHASHLTMDGLAIECKTCPALEACGGGSVMHRWHPIRSFQSPTIYCAEIYNLIITATSLLRQSIGDNDPNTIGFAILPSQYDNMLLSECRRWRKETDTKAAEVARQNDFETSNTSAAGILLRANSQFNKIPFNTAPTSQFWLEKISVHSQESWLVRPFLDTVRTLPASSPQVEHGIATLQLATPLISAMHPGLLNALNILISDIVFVESTVDAEDCIFSFSDNSAPNVLYIAPFAGSAPLGPDDLADSILHEFFHQVLYHTERDAALLLDSVYPRFPAPWKAGLRPSHGFLHGTFVFAGLHRFWRTMGGRSGSPAEAGKAQANESRYREYAEYGINSLRDFALLTRRGELFTHALSREFGISEGRSKPPGVLA